MHTENTRKAEKMVAGNAPWGRHARFATLAYLLNAHVHDTTVTLSGAAHSALAPTRVGKDAHQPVHQHPRHAQIQHMQLVHANHLVHQKLRSRQPGEAGQSRHYAVRTGLLLEHEAAAHVALAPAQSRGLHMPLEHLKDIAVGGVQRPGLAHKLRRHVAH